MIRMTLASKNHASCKSSSLPIKIVIILTLIHSCGNLARDGLAYCSEECKDAEAHASTMPPLTASSLSSPPSSSATSSPLRTTDDASTGCDDDVEDLNLPPSVARLPAKRASNSFSLSYAYNYASKTQKDGTASPRIISSKVTTPFLSSTLVARDPSLQIQHDSPIFSTTISANEQMTFRRRHNQQQSTSSAAASPMSPSNALKSPLLQAARRRSNGHKAASASSSAVSQTSATIPFSPLFRPHTAAVKAAQTCDRPGCPVAHKRVSKTYPKILSSLKDKPHSATSSPLVRRVSEPLSPYLHSPRGSGHDIFDASFGAAVKNTQQSPTLAGSFSSRKADPLDHAAFSGFLSSLHNRKSDEITETRSKTITKQASGSSTSTLVPALSQPEHESGYEANDERDARSAEAALPEVVPTAEQPAGLSNKKRFSGVIPGYLSSSSSSAASSDADGPHSSKRPEARKPTRWLFGRGAGALHAPVPTQTSQARNGASAIASTSAQRPRHNHSTSVGEAAQYVVTIRPSERKTSLNRSMVAPPLIDDESVQAVDPTVQDIGAAYASALLSSSSSDEAEQIEEELDDQPVKDLFIQPPTAAGNNDDAASTRDSAVHPAPTASHDRGRTTTMQQTPKDRAPTVSPFTALQSQGRGRSRQREETTRAGDYRSLSPRRSRSRTRRA